MILTLEVEAGVESAVIPDVAATPDNEKAEQVAEQPADVGLGTAAVTAPVSFDIVVPDIGTEDEVEIIEIKVAVGDLLTVDDTLMTLESDKAAMDVPADRAGEVQEILVSVGDKVKAGTSIVRILTAAAAVESAPLAPPVQPISN